MPGYGKQQRLLKAGDFAAVFKAKPVVSSDRFFRVLGTSSPRGPRLGLAISRKVDKRAVVRNRIKRVIRETFRHWCAESGYGDGQVSDRAVDFVFQARPAAAGACNQNLQAATYQHLTNIQNKLKDIPHAGNP